MTTYENHVAGDDGWSKWIHPIRRGYKMCCCDCGLVHTMDFRIDDGEIEFRVRRNNRSTALVRRHRKGRSK